MALQPISSCAPPRRSQEGPRLRPGVRPRGRRKVNLYYQLVHGVLSPRENVATAALGDAFGVLLPREKGLDPSLIWREYESYQEAHIPSSDNNSRASGAGLTPELGSPGHKGGVHVPELRAESCSHIPTSTTSFASSTTLPNASADTAHVTADGKTAATSNDALE